MPSSTTDVPPATAAQHDREAAEEVREKNSSSSQIETPYSAQVEEARANGELDNLSLLEMKSLLVERAIVGSGMGRYQWCIFFLCGFGYLLDLLWAQAFGLILTPLATELNVPTERQGDIFTAFSTGLCVGAFVWGVLVDIVGRRWAFNLTVLITSLFGLVIGAPDNYNAICVLTAFCGFGLGGNIPIDATILLEFIPQNRRFLLMLLSIFQPIGVVLCSGIAYGLVPKYSCNFDLPSCKAVASGVECCTKASNMGWRYTMYTLGAITLFVFFLRFVVFRFHESPKFLLATGQDEQAVTVVQKIQKFDKKEVNLSIEDFAALARIHSQSDSAHGADEPMSKQEAYARILAEKRKVYDLSHLKALFASKQAARVTILVFIIYMVDYWGFSVAGSFLPSILAKKNASRALSTSETYKNYVIIYTPGIAGVLIGTALVEIPHFGRRWALSATFALMSISLFLYTVINNQAGNIAFNCLEYVFQSAANAVLYGYAPELFPTQVRGTGVGTASTLGRLMSIVSPLIAAHLYASTGSNAVLYLAAAPVLLACVCALLLPETRGRAVY